MRAIPVIALAVACTADPPRPPPPAPVVHRARIVAAGDVMVHRAVKQAARDHATAENNGGFDWIWADTRETVRAADLALANLETPVAPRSHRGVWGEVFNAPPAVLRSLAATGFDLLTFANNHTFDQRPAGLLETLEQIEAAGIGSVGSGRDCARARAPAVRRVNGIRIAVIAWTDLMNFIIEENTGGEPGCTFLAGPRCEDDCTPDRDAFYYHVDEERVFGAVRAARSVADVVILSVHWGVEYATEPLPLYRALAPRLIEAGVDIVLGHHPHVLQPIEWHTARDGRRGLVAYSLGNFVSGMGRTYDPDTMAGKRGQTRDGVLLELTVAKTVAAGGNVEVTIEEVRATPLWTENNHRTRGRGPTHVRVVTHGAGGRRAPGPGTASAALLAERRAAIEAVIGPGWLGSSLVRPRADD